MIGLFAAAVAADSISPSQMQGMRLQAGSTCYEIIAENKPIGKTLQTIKRSQDGPRSTWDIVIHQKATDPRFGRFDMRDHFVVDRRTLLPIRMDSRRGKEGVDRTWHRIELTYGDSAVHGVKRTSSGSTPIDVPLDSPVVDTEGTGIVADDVIATAVAEIFDLSPAGIIEALKLKMPMYTATSSLGHFGAFRDAKQYLWESTDCATALRDAVQPQTPASLPVAI